MGDLTAALCCLLTRAHFAGVPTTRLLWSHVSIAIDAATEEISQEDMISRILEACVQHPLSSIAPRDQKHDVSVLKWLDHAWESRGWAIPEVLRSLEELEEPHNLPELCYKTYVGWGGGSGTSDKNFGGVTLLESCGGIVHHTTGLTTWGGAAVLAEWVTNNQNLIAGKRVLELGAGVGFTASVVLTGLSDDTSPPISYVATDCHHHVLTLLHHNLELNLREEPMKKEELEVFQEATGKILITEETETGEILPWNPESRELRLSLESSHFTEKEEEEVEDDQKKPLENQTKAGTKVEVVQVDWRSPPVLPEVDVILAADVVYAHHLIPPLIALIKSILDGSASKSTMKGGFKHGKTKTHTSNERKTEREPRINKERVQKGVNMGKKDDVASKKTKKIPVERVAYIACTRRSHETINLFLDEVTKQGLCHSLVYQATLDPDTYLFLYNENHLPVRVYKLVLPSKEKGSENGGLGLGKNNMV